MITAFVRHERVKDKEMCEISPKLVINVPKWRHLNRFVLPLSDFIHFFSFNLTNFQLRFKTNLKLRIYSHLLEGSSKKGIITCSACC